MTAGRICIPALRTVVGGALPASLDGVDHCRLPAQRLIGGASTVTDNEPSGRSLRLEVQLDSDEDLRALRGALLAARATELSEIQRRAQRHSLQYGTPSQRESMSEEVANLRRRWTMLDRLLNAIEDGNPSPR